MAECGRAYRFRFSWAPLAVALLRDTPPTKPHRAPSWTIPQVPPSNGHGWPIFGVPPQPYGAFE